ncbi:N-acetyldiaminopimelate deacetylase [Enterococcus sp. LJL120]
MAATYTQDELIALRRSLHQIPEIGLEEVKTHEFLMQMIQANMKDFIEVKEWQTGILVKINGTAPTKTIGWRTDIDGLPITEEVLSDFQSTHPGQMHACGHDFHMTIALGLLRALSETQPKNNYLLLFQPAEENEAGGMIMYEGGAFDDGFMPDEIYALHVSPELPVGTIGTRVGTLFAGTCEVEVNLTGKGGHAAFPHQANDMIIAGMEYIQQAQTVVSRSVDPIQGAVVTFGTFYAGTARNVIAGQAQAAGTIRTLTQEMNELTQRRMQEIGVGIAASFQCEVEVILDQKGYLPVVNHQKETEHFIEFMEAQADVELKIMQPAMTGEDFGYLLDKIPGTMFWLGVDSEFGLHHPKFQPQESALSFAVDRVSRFLKSLDK